MRRSLIVNADDCNLTPGVTRAILHCHDTGILTSTTFMINLPVTAETVKEVLRRKHLGLGIHLNVTLGKPVSSESEIPSLMEVAGSRFKKLREQLTSLPKASHLALEYHNQIQRFQKIFGRKPTHLDTHHQVHDHEFFYDVLKKVARENQLPIRRSQQMRIPEKAQGVRTTQHFLGNLTVEGYWRKEPLETMLENLPEGMSEIMCHPGIHDRDLEAMSSFTTGRVVEYRLFSLPSLRRLTTSLGIALTHFGYVL